MFLDLRSCGSAGFLLVFLGIVGFAASLVALLLGHMRPRLGLVVAPATIAVGLLALLLGAMADARGRGAVDEAVLGVAPGLQEALREQGYREARTCRALGLQSGAMPLAAGAVGLIMALVQRQRRSSAEPGRETPGPRRGT